MKFFNKNKREFEIKSYFQPLAKAVWNERNYEIFAKESYGKNVIVNRCVNLISQNASNIPFLVYDKKTNKPLPNHPLQKLLNKPNPLQEQRIFFEHLYAYKLLAGNSYTQAIFLDEKLKDPKELYLLRPDRITIIPNNTTIPLAYKYKTKHEKIFYVDKITGQCEILHLKNFNPLDDYYGLSVIESAIYAIDQHNEASKWNQSILQNGARPSGALVLHKDHSRLTEEQYRQLKEEVDELFTGSKNAGRPMLLEGGIEWKEMSLKPSEMDFLNIKHSCAREIATAFGIPSQLLGIPGDNTYNNLMEAKLSFWEETIIPLIESTLESFNNWLAPMFDNKVGLYYEREKISALSIRHENYWNKISNADFLSNEEKKKLLDL